MSIPASCIPSACTGVNTKIVRLGSEHDPTRLLQFARRPPLHKCHALVYSSRHQEACTSGCTSESGFSSQYFLFPKKDGGLWAILDLRLLNYAFMNQPFRMLTEFCFAPQYMTEYHVALLFYSCLEIFAFSAMAVEQLTFGHRSRTIQCLKSILSAFCDYLCHSSLSLRCYVHERLMHMTQNWKVSKWSSYNQTLLQVIGN